MTGPGPLMFRETLPWCEAEGQMINSFLLLAELCLFSRLMVASLITLFFTSLWQQENVVPCPREALIITACALPHPCSGNTCCTSALCRHSGHMGCSRSHSPIHCQQKTCPHVVAAGSFIASRHRVHLRCCFPSIQRMVSSSLRS